MNIVLVNHYAGSPQMGMEFRPYYFAKEWIHMGHQVTIIAGDYSHLRKKNPTISKDYQVENIDGITYCWFQTGVYEGNGAKRGLTMLRFCRKLLKYRKQIIKDFNPDVLISSSTYPIDSIPVHWIAKKAKAKHIHEVHDMWPSTLIEVGGLGKLNPFVVAMQIGENYAYSHADEVVALPQHAEQYMIKHGLKNGKYHYIGNGVVLSEWEAPKSLPEEMDKTLNRIKKQYEITVGYIGGHALSNSLDIIIDVAEKLRNEKIAFILVGNGVEKKSLMERCDKMKLDHVYFFDSIDKASVPLVLNYFDCGYLGAKISPLYRFGICMNKMFDYMMGSLPIICAITAPGNPISESNCGIMISSGDVNGIVSAILEVKNMPNEKRHQMGARGKNYILQTSTYQILARKFVDLFN